MSDYIPASSGGKLKLKGVKDSRVDKKKKKKKATTELPEERGDQPGNGQDLEDHSVVLQQLQDEDAKITKQNRREVGIVDGQEIKAGAGLSNDDDVREHLKTEAEKRYDEQRRKRLEERLKKEGVKTHKQRVEELNKYLSNLSEHHDMPKIGPG